MRSFLIVLLGMLLEPVIGFMSVTPPCPGLRRTFLASGRRGWAAGDFTCAASEENKHPRIQLRMAVAAAGKSKLIKAIKKPPGTIAIMAEIKRKDPGTPGLEFPIPSTGELSQSLNTAKVQSIAVWIDEQEYGTSIDDLRSVAAAQQKFKGNFPGPAPVLMLSKAANADHIQAAASAGASGVLLLASLGSDQLSNAIKSCTDSGLEAVVLCRDREQARGALTAGAQVVALDSKHLGIDQTLALADCGVGAQILMAMGGIKTLDDAWRLRDAGFGCVVVGEELMASIYGRCEMRVRSAVCV
jgi:indole-3-glycerol phosphate synthase